VKTNKCVKCGCLIYDTGPLCTTCTAMDAARSNKEQQASPAPPPEALVFHADEDVSGAPIVFAGEATLETPPTVSEPDATEPTSTQPDAASLDLAEPESAQSDAASSEEARPDAARPDAASSEAARPDAARPDATRPDAAQPVSAHLAIARHRAAETHSEEPTPDLSPLEVVHCVEPVGPTSGDDERPSPAEAAAAAPSSVDRQTDDEPASADTQPNAEPPSAAESAPVEALSSVEQTAVAEPPASGGSPAAEQPGAEDDASDATPNDPQQPSPPVSVRWNLPEEPVDQQVTDSPPSQPIDGKPVGQLLNDGPVGIGGWLVLPLLGLILRPVFFLIALINILPVFRAELWTKLTTPGWSSYSAFWAPYFIGTALIGGVLTIWGLVLLVLFLQRRKRVPLLYTLLMVAAAASALFQVFSVLYFSHRWPEAFAEARTAIPSVVFSLVGLAIWIPYFWRSVRVRNTFTRPGPRLAFGNGGGGKG
jgi:hypothetical protein